jgi:hypothetical protein
MIRYSCAYRSVRYTDFGIRIISKVFNTGSDPFENVSEGLVHPNNPVKQNLIGIAAGHCSSIRGSS